MSFECAKNNRKKIKWTVVLLKISFEINLSSIQQRRTSWQTFPASGHQVAIVKEAEELNVSELVDFAEGAVWNTGCYFEGPF